LELHAGAGSCPQAVDIAHPDAHAGTHGAGHSTHFWGESESLLEQEQPSDQSTTTATTLNMPDPTHVRCFNGNFEG